MKKVRFESLSLGDEFIYRGRAYIRTQDEFKGCCNKVHNCKLKDTDKKGYVHDHVVVEINEQSENK